MADLLAYLRVVGRHWKAGTTGGILAVVLMLSGTFHPLPRYLIAAALLGYLLVAGFYAWREQYQQGLARPLERRERVDALLEIGTTLMNRCIRQKKVTAITRWRIASWLNSANLFVRHNFRMVLYDNFIQFSQPPRGMIFRTEMAKLKEQLPTEVADHVLKIAASLEGLERIRSEIRD